MRNYPYYFSITLALGSILFVAPLAAQAILYAPGQTLNPACAPTDPTCGVSTTVGSISPGTIGQVPYYMTNGNALTATSSISILSNGNVGIGATTPGVKLDVRGDDYRLSNNYVVKEFNVSFPDQVSNQKVDFYMSGTQQFFGTIEVAVADSYGVQNASGLIKKVYALGLNPGGTIYTNDARYTEVLGDTADHWALSDLSWDATNSRYKITLVHRANSGNAPRISIKAFGERNDFADNAATFTMGSIYTTNGTLYGRPYEHFNGNVGIGTSSPQGKLDVSGASSLTTLNSFDGTRAVSIINTNTTNNNSSGLDFRTNDANGLLTTGAKIMGVYTSHAANAVSGDLAFLTRNAGTVGEAMRITSDGKIGIGTPTPALNLDGTFGISLEGNGGATSYTETTYRNNSGAGNITLNHARGTQSVPLALNANDTVGTIYFQAYNLNGTLQTTGAISSLVNDQVSGSDKGSLVFMLNSGTDEAMRIVGGVTTGGILKNVVGIGTSSPAYTLDVRDNSGSNVQSLTSRVLNVGNAATRFDTTTSTPSSYAGFFNSTSFRSAGSNALTNIGIYSTASGAQNNYSAIFDQGNVGIGTTSPGAKLDVAGTIRQTGCLNGALSSNASGDIICTSDLAFKQNVTPFTAGLSALEGINPSYFQYKGESFTHAGFIAQNVQTVLPDAVSEQSNGSLGLDTNAILAAAVNAIKELDVRINGGVPTAIATAQSSLQSLANNIGQTASALTSDAFTQIASWLGDAGNGIAKIFVGDVESKKSSTESLCVKNATGETCITRDQLDALIAGAPASAVTTPTVVLPAKLFATSSPTLETSTTTPEATSTPLLPNTGSVARFDRTLDMGSSGTDVTALQTILMQKGFLYLPSGMSPGYFGALTREAVMKYQNSVGLPPLGVVGPLTRAKLNGEL